MAVQKKRYSKTTLSEFSVLALRYLERQEVFQKASCIALYHAIPGEVETASFIADWHMQKKILLPVVNGNDLQFSHYTGEECLQAGTFGILEPCGEIIPGIEKEIDLMIVPGVAFDRQLNRLGRGKGYYDRILSTVNAFKIGLCFHFQLFPEIPTEVFDERMDCIVTDKEVVMR